MLSLLKFYSQRERWCYINGRKYCIEIEPSCVYAYLPCPIRYQSSCMFGCERSVADTDRTMAYWSLSRQIIILLVSWKPCITPRRGSFVRKICTVLNLEIRDERITCFMFWVFVSRGNSVMGLTNDIRFNSSQPSVIWYLGHWRSQTENWVSLLLRLLARSTI